MFREPWFIARMNDNGAVQEYTVMVWGKDAL